MEMRGEEKIGADPNRTVGSAMTLLLLFSGLSEIPRAEGDAMHWQLAEQPHAHTISRHVPSALLRCAVPNCLCLME